MDIGMIITMLGGPDRLKDMLKGALTEKNITAGTTGLLAGITELQKKEDKRFMLSLEADAMQAHELHIGVWQRNDDGSITNLKQLRLTEINAEDLLKLVDLVPTKKQINGSTDTATAAGSDAPAA